MEVGLLLSGLATADKLSALAAAAERLGFDSVWAGDHVAFPAPIIDPLQVLACFAAATRVVRLGTCVYLVPLRHPTVTAKQVASLDYLSGGRVVFGIGVGGEFPREFEASGVPVRQRGGRTNEALPLLRRLWSGEPVAHSGRYFRFDSVQLKPPPTQKNGPPIWVGGRSTAALERTAMFGDGYVGYLLDPAGFGERMRDIRGRATAAGRDATTIAAALMTFAVVDESRDAALDRAAAVLGAMYGRDMRRAAERYCVVGTENDCGEAAARFAAAGVEHLILGVIGEPFAQIRSLAAALSLTPRTIPNPS